ncbi:MAG: hypothetical protein KGY50_03565 [Candidatus Thermoplasmatota archaeon]|nr:hypothetical protein [Candidatus Thermoplasmatota archaeon]
MDMELLENMGHILAAVILLILPLLILLIATIVGFSNAVLYILAIFWFGMGFIFYGALYSDD